MKPNGSRKTRGMTKTKAYTVQSHYIERQPREDWFIRARNERGEREWFLRIQCTGLYPRRFGPFPTKDHALRFLNDVARHALDGITGTGSEWEPSQECIREDELGGRYLASMNANPRPRRQVPSQKGR